MAGYYDRDRNTRNSSGDITNRDASGTMNYPMTHHGNVAEYQASGFPYVITLDGAQSDTRIRFPYVTQWICVAGLTHDVSFAFKSGSSDDGTGNAMKFTLKTNDENSPPVFHLRCVDLYVTSSGPVSIAAGMTGVPRDQFPDISDIEGVKTAALGTAAAATQ